MAVVLVGEDGRGRENRDLAHTYGTARRYRTKFKYAFERWVVEVHDDCHALVSLPTRMLSQGSHTSAPIERQLLQSLRRHFIEEFDVFVCVKRSHDLC